MEICVMKQGDARGLLGTLADGSVDLVCTDPPYRGHDGGPGGHPMWNGTIFEKNDGRIFTHNDIAPQEYFPELYRVMKPSADAYIMTNALNLRDMLNCANDVGFGFHQLLCWHKNTKRANRWYLKEVEYVLYLWKPPARTIRNPTSGQVFYYPMPRGRERQHPTQKPPELWEYFIHNSSEEGDTVLDPFMGVGSTGVAARRMKRGFIGYELDVDYFVKAVMNIQNARPRPLQAFFDYDMEDVWTAN